MPYRLDRKRWNCGIDDPELTRLRAEGKTDTEIGAQMSYSSSTIYDRRRILGLKRNGKWNSSRLPPDRPIRAVLNGDPGWDFSRDNLDLPGGRFAK